MRSRTKVMLFLLGILVLSLAVFYKDIFLFINESALPEVSEKSVEDSSVTVEISNKTIQIELANTPALRTLGLSGRDSLAPDHGMLFVFEKPDRYGFWMKEMNFSIDIIWIDASKKIVHIEERVSPESYPKIYIPDAQALFVLEVPAGFVTENKIRVGDEVKF